jgi:hypothetical protein
VSTLTRVLLITTAGATVYRLRRAQVYEAFSFEDSPTGHDGFARYVAEDPGAPVGVLVDRPDEAFRLEQVPHVRMDRGNLLNRHLARLFPDTGYRHALVLGRATQGRRDDRVLFSALLRPDTLQPWLSRLAEARVPVAAVTSVAFISARLLEPLGCTGDALIASYGEGGLRQTVFIGGELRFSRLAPLPDSSADHLADTMAAEIARTIQYLQRPDDAKQIDQISTHLVAGPELHSGAATGNGALRLHAGSQLARAMGCSGHAGRDSYVLFAELLARGEPNRYAGPAERRHYVHALGLRALQLTCVALAFGMALASARNLYATLAANEATAAARHALAAAAPEPGAAVDIAEAARIRDLVTTADRHLATRLHARPLLERTGAVLAQFPEFQLEDLSFTIETDPPADPNGAITLHGHIAGSTGDRRTLTQRFDALVAAMMQVPDAEGVEILERPFDVQGRIAGSVDDQPETAPGFRVRLKVAAS